MFPYIEHPTFQVGPATIHAFGLLAATAILVGVTLVTLRAPRIGLDRDDALNLTVWTIVWGLVGSHLFSVLAYYPDKVARDPLELLRVWGSMSSFGGIVGGLAAAWILMRRYGMSRDQRIGFVDQVAFAFPFAWILGRAGCSLAHDHVGIATDHWLAVQFPEGPRFDLGLLEFLYTLLVLAPAFLVLDRWRWPGGFWLATFFVLYGPVRFVLDTLRTDDVRYLGWTPAQYVCVAVTLLGILLLVRLFRKGPDQIRATAKSTEFTKGKRKKK